MSSVMDIKNDQLGEEIEQASLAILDFWSVTCGSCKAMFPVIEEIAKQFEGEIRVARINVDENPNLTQRFGIRGLPSLIVLKGGQPAKKILGVHSLDNLKTLIQGYQQS